MPFCKVGSTAGRCCCPLVSPGTKDGNPPGAELLAPLAYSTTRRLGTKQPLTTVLLYLHLKNPLSYSQNRELFATAHLLSPATLVQASSFCLPTPFGLQLRGKLVAVTDSSLVLTSQQ